MKRFSSLLIAVFVSVIGAVNGWAGTISYVGIPSVQSDLNCGISRNHGYTTAVDGGNSRGTDRAVNGITLYALTGKGQNTATADNCTLNALSGTLTDGGLTSKNIAADGTQRDVLSDMVFNNAGGDNSQVEIVLDPESLEQGSTYDLRVYICPSSGQNRQVNLAFFGDGQNAAETGFFNEDDARTSAGGFPAPGQVYYINFRFTWDGDSTPGITVTQKSGGAPFCLYALTNELVEGEPTAGTGGGTGVAAAGGGTEEGAGEQAAGGEGEGDDGLSSGLVDQESDEVGVESDDFYGSESLKSHGRWVKLSKWGTCWQPTEVTSGWCPYTNGSWKECDDCGWTFVSDEPWAWACYHYGRWAKVSLGCGWAWVPGKVWAPSWVSWRQGKDESCNCLGWAPLPPEAGCELGVGISSWVDSTCDIGPECYTFINIRDFGSDSYYGCGCIYERGRNTTIIIDTFNCTNICHDRGSRIFCGGPDRNWCNTRIRQLGGKECGQIHVNRYDNPGRLGGKFARHEGNQLGLVSPKIHGTKNPKFRPNIAESAGANKIDHGWKGIKDKKQEQQVRNHFAQENKGKNPRNSPAKMPDGVAEKMKHHGQGAGQGAGQGGQTAGGGLRPGGKGRGQGQGQGQGLGGQAQGGAAGGGDQHPGKGRHKGQGQMATGGGTGPSGQGGGFDQHPGKNRVRGQGRMGQKNTGGLAGGTQGGNQGGNQGANQGTGGGMGPRHPGQSFKKQKGGQAAAGGTGGGQTGSQGGGAGQHPGRHKGQGLGGEQAGNQGAGGAQGGGAGAGGQDQAGGGRAGKGRHRQQGLGGAKAQGSGGQQMQQQDQGTGGQQAATGGGGGGRGKGHRRQQQQQQQGGGQGQAQGTDQGGGSGANAGGGGGQGQGRHRKQQQAMQQGGGGQGQMQGGGGQAHHRQQQQVQQQQQQQQVRQQRQQQGQGQGQGQGGGGRRRKGNATPPPG